MSEKFYKLARPDGFDFYTGKTINYRENVGKIVKCPNYNRNGKLCSDSFIHASREPNQCFIGATIPCSAYLVSGKLIKEDYNKCGFKQFNVIKELNPEKLFKWNYPEACNPIHPFKIKPPKRITKKHLALLKNWESVRASVWDSVGASVWASVGDSVRESVRASVWDSVGASVWASVRASVWAYIGSLFTSVIKEWKYIKHKTGEYPFQPAVDLWKMGLVPSYDGRKWRLHGHEDVRVLWEGELKK